MELQFDQLLLCQPELEILLWTEERIEIVGCIHVHRSAKGFTVNKFYPVKIVLPLDREELPRIYDEGFCINQEYVHQYREGRLCLETDSSIELYFSHGFSLVHWVRDFVEPYYFSYEFYQRYGCYPFGERKHGIESIISSYGDCFHETDTEIICKLMHHCITSPYRGHWPCPCGSEKTLRSCHGKYLIQFYNDKRKREILTDDVNFIIRWIQHEKTRQ